MDQAMAGWPARVAAEAALERCGRTLDADVLIEIGDKAWLAAIRRGQVVALQRGPFVLPAFTLALRITAEGMARFLAPAPVPGWHDLLALRRQGALRIEGDTAVFFAHLAWFKGALANSTATPSTPSSEVPDIRPMMRRTGLPAMRYSCSMFLFMLAPDRVRLLRCRAASRRRNQNIR